MNFPNYYQYIEVRSSEDIKINLEWHIHGLSIAYVKGIDVSKLIIAGGEMVLRNSGVIATTIIPSIPTLPRLDKSDLLLGVPDVGVIVWNLPVDVVLPLTRFQAEGLFQVTATSSNAGLIFMAVLRKSQSEPVPEIAEFNTLWIDLSALDINVYVAYAKNASGLGFTMTPIYNANGFVDELGDLYKYVAILQLDDPTIEPTEEMFSDLWEPIVSKDSCIYIGYASDDIGTNFNYNKNKAITYDVDATAKLADVVIDEYTGIIYTPVEYTGTITITATAQGVNGPVTDTVDVDVVEYTDSTKDLADIVILEYIDPTPIHKVFKVNQETYTFDEDGTRVFVYVIVPEDLMDGTQTIGRVIVSKEFYREKMFEGYICIPIGMLNSDADGRAIYTVYDNVGIVSVPGITPPDPPIINKDYDYEWLACELIGGVQTGVQLGIKKEKVFNEVTELFDYTGVQEPTTRSNMTDCAPPASPKLHVRIYTGQTWDASSAQNKDVSIGSKKMVQSTVGSDFAYLFISLPNGHDFEFLEGGGLYYNDNLVSQSISDNVSGYIDNTVYRVNPDFDITEVSNFYITIL